MLLLCAIVRFLLLSHSFEIFTQRATTSLKMVLKTVPICSQVPNLYLIFNYINCLFSDTFICLLYFPIKWAGLRTQNYEDKTI